MTSSARSAGRDSTPLPRRRRMARRSPRLWLLVMALALLLSPRAFAQDMPEDDEDQPLPPGHPSMPAGQGGAAKDAAPGMFQPPPDTESEDPALPKGTIVIELRDAENN